MVWVDDLNQEGIGTNFIVTGGNVPPDESVYSDIQTTTPAPVRGESKKCLPLAPMHPLKHGVLRTLENCDVEITSQPYENNK